MKHRIITITLWLIGSSFLSLHAQENDFTTGKNLFEEKAYSAAISPLTNYLEVVREVPTTETQRMQAHYMLACISYELQQPDATLQLENVLKAFPESPYNNRLKGVLASAYFFDKEYEQALTWFEQCDFDQLSDEERDDFIYRMAVSYLQQGNLTEAASWFLALSNTSSRYDADSKYYLAYIRYSQQRFDEALEGFLSLQSHPKYEALVPYYMAEIYLQTKQYAKAEEVANGYLEKYKSNEHTAQMYRIKGAVNYHLDQPKAAADALKSYLQLNSEKPRRDALYMLGLSCYNAGLYGEVVEHLNKVTTIDDALAQNAYLNMGLAALKLGDKTQARMFFEQAAASNADVAVKELAAYNHALIIHETAYSAFGESVTVFERFLNDFPQSRFTDKVSSYLVEVYMNTKSYDAALQSIERIAQPSSEILGAKQKILFQLGTQAFTNTLFSEAINYFNRSIELSKYNRQIAADAHYWRGETYYRQGEWEKAKRDFQTYQQQTLQKNIQMYALSEYNLGYILFREKQYANAARRFLAFASAEKEQNKSLLGDAYNRIADCYLNNRQFEEAKQYYNLAEAQGTVGGDYAYYQLALVAGLQKDYSKKVSLLNELSKRYPQSPYHINALYEKGRSYVQQSANDQAIKAFQELVSNYPDSPLSRKAATEIGLLHYQDDNYDKAIQTYKQVVINYPGSEEAKLAMRDLKSLYVETNRVDEYAKLITEMPGNIRFEVNEQDSLTYIAAEKVYMRADNKQAKQSFERYLQSYPQGAFSLNAHYYLALMAKTAKNDAELLEHTAKLLEYPDSPFSEEALVMQAETLSKQKRHEEALATYKQLQVKASTIERKRMGLIGALLSASQLNNSIETIHAATSILAEEKISPEIKNEARYLRSMAYLQEQANEKAFADWQELAKDLRTVYGAEAKYRMSQMLFDDEEYAAAEQQVLQFIDQSTPHAYWLARAFVLLSDVYAAQGKNMEARQYLLSLKQNYQADDDIAGMIEERLATITEE